MDEQVTLSACLDEIRTLIRDNRSDDAIALCRHVLHYYPKQIGAYQLMAEACLGKDDMEGAQELFRRVLSADPENVLTYVGLGMIFEQQNLPGEAIWHLERAYELDPTSLEIRKELLRLYGEVEAKPRQRLKLTSGALARLYVQEGLFYQAIQEFRALANADPRRFDVRVALAETLWRAGRMREAADIAESLLEALPFCLKANLILGTVWAESGLTESEQHLENSQALDPTNQVAHDLLNSRSPLPVKEILIPRYVPGQEPAPAIEQAQELTEEQLQAADWFGTNLTTDSALAENLATAQDESTNLASLPDSVSSQDQDLQVPPPGFFDEVQTPTEWLVQPETETPPAAGLEPGGTETLQAPAGWEIAIPPAISDLTQSGVEAIAPKPPATEADLPPWLQPTSTAEQPAVESPTLTTTPPAADSTTFTSEQPTAEPPTLTEAPSVDSASPAWLAELQKTYEEPLTPSMPPPTDTLSSAPGEIPAWVSGQNQSTTGTEPSPEWLQQLPPSEEMIAPSWATLSPASPSTPTTETGMGDTDLPGWVTGTAPAPANLEPQPEFPEMYVPDTEPGSQPPVPSEPFPELSETQLPPWMAGAVSEPSAVEPTAELPPSTSAEQNLQEQAGTDLPPWMSGVSEQGPAAEPLAASQDTQIFDLRQEFPTTTPAPDQSPAQEPPAPADLPPWISEVASQIAPTPTQEHPEERTDLPSWLPESPAEPVASTSMGEQQPIDTEQFPPAQTDLPDWLASAASVPSQLAPSEPSAELDQFVSAQAPQEPAQETAQETDLLQETQTDLPDWLASAAAVPTQSSISEPQLQSPQESAPTSAGETALFPVANTDLPDWLASAEPVSPAPPIAERPSESEQVRPPAEPQELVAETGPVSELFPELGTQAPAETRAPGLESADELDEDLPDWLKQAQISVPAGNAEPEIPPAPTADQAPEVVAPHWGDWDSALVDATVTTQPPAEDLTTSRELAVPQQEFPAAEEAPAAAEPDTRLPEPPIEREPQTLIIPSPENIEALVPAPGTIKPPTIPVELPNPEKLAVPTPLLRRRREPKGGSHLDQARALCAANQLPEALVEYDYIVQHAPRLVNQVIQDLEEITHHTGAPLDAHRILGDAYTRVDRLAEALERYRFVLDRVS